MRHSILASLAIAAVLAGMPAAAIPALRKLLEDSDEEVHREAEKALRTIAPAASR